VRPPKLGLVKSYPNVVGTRLSENLERVQVARRRCNPFALILRSQLFLDEFPATSIDVLDRLLSPSKSKFSVLNGVGFPLPAPAKFYVEGSREVDGRHRMNSSGLTNEYTDLLLSILISAKAECKVDAIH
jgi:hypothetical protein